MDNTTLSLFEQVLANRMHVSTNLSKVARSSMNIAKR